jgi:hypothetical protein
MPHASDPPRKDPFYGNTPAIRVSVVLAGSAEADTSVADLAFLPEWVDDLIAVDDSSIDASFAAARRLAGPPIQHHECGALRGGFSTTTGEVVLVLDSARWPSQTEFSTFVMWLLRDMGSTAGQPAPPGSKLSTEEHGSAPDWEDEAREARGRVQRVTAQHTRHE